MSKSDLVAQAQETIEKLNLLSLEILVGRLNSFDSNGEEIIKISGEMGLYKTPQKSSYRDITEEPIGERFLTYRGDLIIEKYKGSNFPGADTQYRISSGDENFVLVTEAQGDWSRKGNSVQIQTLSPHSAKLRISLKKLALDETSSNLFLK